MAWGDYGVSKRLRLSNGVQAWGAGNLPSAIPIQQAGILEELRFQHTSGNITLGGGTPPTGDVLGPWNGYTQHTVAPNNSTPIYQASGIGAFHISQATSLDRYGTTPDITLFLQSGAPALTDTFQYPSTTGNPSKFYLPIPISQRVASLGGLIGMWPLNNPAVQLQYTYVPNGVGPSPFNVYNATVGANMYSGGATSPTATMATPQVEIYRNLWEVPADPRNLPVFNLVSTWFEDVPQGASVLGATTIKYQVQPLSGLLVRLYAFIFDGTTSKGVAQSSGTGSNAFLLTTDANTPKFSESFAAVEARQNAMFGYNLSQGLFGADLMYTPSGNTLQDTLDTAVVGNITLQFNLNVALGGSNSYCKIYRQLIVPQEVR